ncbi:MAG: response regulator transcription factor [Eubacteriales bacterium]|nr:response regulator transcription factor [Eubacteriales bacterium]
MRILIIDDDILVANALKMILESDKTLSVTGTGSDGADAVRMYRSQRPDVLLMDIRMKEVNGLTASEQILSEYPDAKILLLTTFSDDEYIVKALKAGVKGYLLKQDYNSIIPAIKAVYTGQTVFGTEIVSRIPDLLEQKSGFNYKDYEISEREYEIITLVAEGLSNKEIAGNLHLSEGTIRNYLSGILDKMHLRDRTQLAVFYYQHR